MQTSSSPSSRKRPNIAWTAKPTGDPKGNNDQDSAQPEPTKSQRPRLNPVSGASSSASTTSSDVRAATSASTSGATAATAASGSGQASSPLSFVPPPRDCVCEAMRRLYGYRLTTTSGGNISHRCRADGSVWLTPKGTDKGDMYRNQILYMTTDGVWHSETPELKPSTEHPLHLRLYSKLPHVFSIIHAHPPYLGGFAVTALVPNTRAIASAYCTCGSVGLCPYACPGTETLASLIEQQFASGAMCVLMANHGIMVAGDAMGETFNRFETLEFCSGAISNAVALSRANKAVGDPVNILTDAQLKSYSCFSDEVSSSWIPHLPTLVSIPCTPQESEAKYQISRFAARAYTQRLTSPSGITISSRIGPDSFVITPAYIDAANLAPADVITVKLTSGGNLNGAPLGYRSTSTLLPTCAASHAAIYATHPSINVVITAHPVFAMAFAISSNHFEGSIIPEGYIVLRDVPVLDFQASITPSMIASTLLQAPGKRPPPPPPAQPQLISPVAAIVRNDAVYVTGASLLQAFDRLEVMEAMAQQTVCGSQQGSLSLLGVKSLVEIEEGFF